MTLPDIIHTRILEKKRVFESLGRMPDRRIKEIEERMAVEFVYNTNRIEGSELTRGETRLVLEGMTAGHKPLAGVIHRSLDDIRAAGNHPPALEFIKKLAFERTHRITEKEIRRLHGMIMEGIIPDAGRYRTYEREVVGAGFKPPPHYDVPRLMKNMVDMVDKNPDELRPVELAAQAHYDLAWIHPFGDGNGRMARLLLNFILLRNGYPFTVVKDVEKATYLRTLRQMDTEGEIEPFTTYIARCLEQTLDLYLAESGQTRARFLPLAELARGTPYSAEYLSLLARKGRIDAIKEGKTWKSTRKVVATYVAQQRSQGQSKPRHAKPAGSR